jgi:hypothetical protein
VRIFRRTNEDGNDDAQIPGKVLIQLPPGRPATFSRARTIGDFVIFDWDTNYGTIGWAHYLKVPGVSALSLSAAAYAQFWDHMHVYTALVLGHQPP